MSAPPALDHVLWEDAVFARRAHRDGADVGVLADRLNLSVALTKGVLSGRYLARKDAVLSDDQVYRYRLDRVWDDSPDMGRVVFVLLNPSKADAYKDDATVRRGIGYAIAWGYGSLTFANLFALRSTDPKAMLAHPAPVGPDNDNHILDAVKSADKVVVAWGNNGAHRGRDEEVYRFLMRNYPVTLYALGFTKQWQPVHPLRQPKKATLKRWEPR